MVNIENFTTQSKNLNVKNLLGYIWYQYLNLFFGVIGHDFDYDLGLCLCGGDWFDEMKRYTAATCHMLQPYRMFWEHSGSEYLATYYANESAYAFYRQDTAL